MCLADTSGIVPELNKLSSIHQFLYSCHEENIYLRFCCRLLKPEQMPIFCFEVKQIKNKLGTGLLEDMAMLFVSRTLDSSVPSL